MKSKFIRIEFTQDADTGEWGLILWLRTKSEKNARIRARMISRRYNAAPVPPKAPVQKAVK